MTKSSKLKTAIIITCFAIGSGIFIGVGITGLNTHSYFINAIGYFVGLSVSGSMALGIFTNEVFV